MTSQSSRRAGARGCIVIAVLFAAACGSDSTGPEASRGIRFISGANATDSAAAFLAEPLVVEVHDSSGHVAPAGTVVRFTAAPRTGTSTTEVTVEGLTASAFTALAVGSTDASGRTAVMVRLGTAAGTGRVVITVPTLGLTDTARFTITPGAGVKAQVLPADTAVTVGKGLTLRGGITDQFGNPTTDPVTWSVSGTGATISTTGTLTATAAGRYKVTVTGGKGTAIGNVSVVPPFRFVVATGYPTSRLLLVDSDGSNVKTLTTYADGGIGPHPSWVPGTANIVYTNSESGLQTLKVVDTNGVVRSFFTSSVSGVTHQAEPAATANGQWVYFSAYDQLCSNYLYCLYRARADGSAAEGLWQPVGSNVVSWRPAPSPDGSRVAFVTTGNAVIIKVLDVSTRTLSSWSVNGQQPAWSPDGTQIVYVTNYGGPLLLVNADGTGAHAFTATGKYYVEAPISWSPDGRWILARSTTYELIDMATGQGIPLPYASSYPVMTFKR